MTEILKAVETTRDTIVQAHEVRIEKLDKIQTLAEELAELDTIIAGQPADPPVTRKPKKARAPDSKGAKPKRPESRGDLDDDVLRVVSAAYPDGVGRSWVIEKLADKGYSDWTITSALKRLVAADQLVVEGRGRGTKYLIAHQATADVPAGGGVAPAECAEQVLAALTKAGGKLTQRQLTRFTGLEPNQVSGGLNVLIDQGQAHRVLVPGSVHHYELAGKRGGDR